jgi:hypothetical protein
MKRGLLVVILVCACGPKKAELPPARSAWPPDRAGYVNPIPAENAKAGNADYYDGREVQHAEIEGYVSRISTTAGGSADVMLSTDTTHRVHWSLYRLGWYGGAKARRVLDGADVMVSPQPECPRVTATGLIQCHWATAFTVTVPADAVSGLFLLKFARDDGYTSFAPIVVTDDRPADLLMQASVDTYQAYNDWQGQSLYIDQSGQIPGGLGISVSFDRPYGWDRGSGQVLRYEALFAAFLEQNSYDVSYTTNPMVSAGGREYLEKRGAFLSVGHDEYWTGEERDAVQGARDSGVPVLFFGANAAYWKVRYEGGGDPTNPRLMTCYKSDPTQDPVKGVNASGEFRLDPINRPENELVGTMYESYEWLSGPWTVADATSFLYAGTGLKNGDQLPFLVGYEYDRTQENGVEPKVNIVAHSPVVNAYGNPSWSDAVTYTGPRGSLVFGAGTIEWANGLGLPGVADQRVQRMTANVLNKALNLPIPLAMSAVVPPPAPTIIRTNGAASVTRVAHGFPSPTSIAPAPAGAFYVVDPSVNQVFRAGPSDSDPVTVIAGDGKPSNKPQYDNVAGLAARFRAPTAIVMLPNGDLIVADTGNHCLRRILPDASHTVSTVAGTLGKGGYVDGTGTSARFKNPMALALDPTTGDLIVADTGNSRLRRVNTTTWAVTTEAGTGGGVSDGPALHGAKIAAPTAVAVASDGRIFLVESSNSRICAIATDSDRTLTTIAGGTHGRDDGTGDHASLAPQGGLLWDGTALYVSEPGVNRIRRIVPGATAATTTVETWAGSGQFGSLDGTGEEAQLASPLGLARSTTGEALVANGADGSIRKIRF